MLPGENSSERLKRVIPRSIYDSTESKYFIKLFDSVKEEKNP
jgi:hypothetical protein